MKKVLVTAMFLLTGYMASAQISKADVEIALSSLGTSMEKMESVFVGNELTFFQDNSWNHSYNTYVSSRGAQFKLWESGIAIVGGGSVVILPYSQLKRFSVTATTMNLTLAD